MTEQVKDNFTVDSQIFQILAWICFVSLLLNAGKGMSGMLGAIDMQTASFGELFNGFWKAFLTHLPTFLLAWAVFDLAKFFGRCQEGEVFTRRNVKTLKVSAESLVWAAAVIVVIAPTVISWIDRVSYGIVWDSNDLALGIGAVGLALYGFAGVLSEAVKLKEDNDEMV